MKEQMRISKPKAMMSAAVAAVLAVGLSIPVANAYAAPSDDKQAEANAALEKLNQYQSELDQASANYEAAHQDQLDAEARVQEAQNQIEEKTAQIENDQQRLGERARDMYRSGDTSFIDVILGASTFEQFATTWNMLETLNSNDAQLVAETKTARQELEAAKQEAQEQAQVASDKADEAKSIASSAEAKASEMQSVYDNLSAEAQALVAQEKAAAEAAQQQAAAAAEANNTAGNSASSNASSNNSSSNNSNSNSSSNSSSNSGSSTNNDKVQTVTGNTVVDRAYSQLGKPYSWGACGPNSFDCSGLVSYCLTGSYSRLGTTYTFMGWTRVTNPQPGDVVTNDHHCGIYIGGGQMIHAPQTGDVVKISSVQSSMIYVRY